MTFCGAGTTTSLLTLNSLSESWLSIVFGIKLFCPGLRGNGGGRFGPWPPLGLGLDGPLLILGLG